MAQLKLGDISKRMRKLDICMMTSVGSRGHLVSRPMSNNGDVKYDGNSYFYTYEKSNIVKQVKENNSINLGFQGKDDMYISIDGKAKLIKDKATLKEHWTDSLKQWFKDGVETEGITMLHVKAKSIKFWHNEENGEVKL